MQRSPAGCPTETVSTCRALQLGFAESASDSDSPNPSRTGSAGLPVRQAAQRSLSESPSATEPDRLPSGDSLDLPRPRGRAGPRTRRRRGAEGASGGAREGGGSFWEEGSGGERGSEGARRGKGAGRKGARRDPPCTRHRGGGRTCREKPGGHGICFTTVMVNLLRPTTMNLLRPTTMNLLRRRSFRIYRAGKGRARGGSRGGGRAPRPCRPPEKSGEHGPGGEVPDGPGGEVPGRACPRNRAESTGPPPPPSSSADRAPPSPPPPPPVSLPCLDPG